MMIKLKNLKMKKEFNCEPLQMRVTGKDGKVEFQLYISGKKIVIEQAITYLQEYLKLIKSEK